MQILASYVLGGTWVHNSKYYWVHWGAAYPLQKVIKLGV